MRHLVIVVAVVVLVVCQLVVADEGEWGSVHQLAILQF